MENKTRSGFSTLFAVKNSLTLKLFILGVIFVALMIPLFLTSSLRIERSGRAAAAEKEVSAKWGTAQTITAPVLQLGIIRQLPDKKTDKKTREQNVLTLLPEKLNVTGIIVPEPRHRGIYPVLLYHSTLVLEGEFSTPPIEEISRDGWQINPAATSLQFAVSDVKGITAFQLEFGGRNLRLVPGCRFGTGWHCDLPWPATPAAPENPVKFRAEIGLNGCRQLLFQPVGRDFTLTLKSSWPHPSFTGGFLPASREVSAAGFTAEWKINEINRSYPQYWMGREYRFDPGNTLGVALVQPSNPYQQTERVSSYAALFIVIILAAFLIGELTTKIWIHPLQYLFSGLAIIMFYLLLLSMVEHFSFTAGYLISAAAIVLLTTGYAFAIFSGRRTPALLLGAVTALAYALIYTLTRMEDYALLAGSIILLLLLALLMKLTGHLNRQP